LRLVDHGGELGAEEIDMVIGRVLRAMVDRGGTLLRAGCTAMLVLSEEEAGRVPELVKGGEVATTLAHGHEGLPAHCFK
jgi:hypothetical protein